MCVPPSKDHPDIIQQRRRNYQKPNLKSLRNKLKRRQQIVIPLIQSYRCGNCIITESIRETFAKRTPDAGANDVVAGIEYEQCNDGAEPEETEYLREEMPSI